MISVFFKNWKTTLMGVVAAVLGGLTYNGVIDQSVATVVLSMITAIIGFLSKDGDQTGLPSK